VTALFQKTLRKNLEELIALTREVDAFLAEQSVPPPAVFRVQLVLEETIRNLIEHAPAAQRIDVRLAFEADLLVLEIEDDGDYFDLRSAPAFDKSQPLETRRSGGMGIQLLRALIPDLDYQRVESGNRLRVTIPCS
jgi:anti-sigma regulatory factor (Ser/Thr protein kinase)